SESLQPPSQQVKETASISSMPSVSTTDKTLRKYQSTIADMCESHNTLVVLPTGAGKTAIAAEAIKRIPQPALFLVPTNDLVRQQARALRSWTGLNVVELKGGQNIPIHFEVLVATAGAFGAAQFKGNDRLRWESFRIVVFDEVHHVIKKHKYRELALSLRASTRAPGKSAPRVLGLTASYSYAFGDAEARDALTKMCRELGITEIEVATREELERDGCHSVGAEAEVRLPPSTITPKGVLPERERCHQPASMFLLRERVGESTDFARRLMACVRGMEKAIAAASEHPGFKSPLAFENDIKAKDWGAYAHKLARSCDGVMTARTGSTSVGKTPESKRRPSLRQLPPSHRPMLAELEHWYEAVKILVVSWEERQDDAATILDMFGCTGSVSQRRSEQQHKQQNRPVWPVHVLQKVTAFWAEVPRDFPRYEHLKEVLVEKHKQHGGDGSGGGDSGGKSFRGIVFVRQRVTTHVLAHVIASDPLLAPLFNTTCLYAASSPATASLALSKEDTKESIEAFRSGRVNLLVATNVAEEGMDIPAANCVIRYDAVDHVVSMVQGRGRARDKESSYVVLYERPNRTAADLEAVEQRRMRDLDDFEPEPTSEIPEPDPYEFQNTDIEGTRSADTRSEYGQAVADELDSFSTGTSSQSEHRPGDMIGAVDQESSSSIESDVTSDEDHGADQRCPELEACDGLLDIQAKHGLRAGTSANGTPITPPVVLAAVDSFAERTKAVLKEGFERESGSGLWTCNLSYESSLRHVQASGRAAIGKKMARKLPATTLASRLVSSIATVEPDGSRTASDGPHKGIADADDHQAPETEEVDGTRVSTGTDESSSTSHGSLLADQERRESAARGILLDLQAKHGLGVGMSANGAPIPPPGVLAAVDLFAEEAGVVLKEKFEQDSSSGLWVCRLLYDSPLRRLEASGGAARGKKTARKLAATSLASGFISNTAPVQPANDRTAPVEPLEGMPGAVNLQPPTSDGFPKTHVSRSAGEISNSSEDARQAHQRRRELAARGVLLDVRAKHGLGVGVSANGTPIPPPGVLAAVDLFAEKTGVVLKEAFEQESESGRWVLTLVYESALRRVEASGGAANGKKVARKLAAAKLVARLLEAVPG
ncbi:unnamed protein product, partial [Scytosiphon promiscuus]